MKVSFEGTDVELVALLAIARAGISSDQLTKEQFMVAMTDLTQKLTADRDAVLAYIASRDAGDADLKQSLKDAVATIATDEAQLAELHAEIDAAFATAKEIGDAVNPPPVVVPDPPAPPAVAPTPDPVPAAADTSGAAAAPVAGDVPAPTPADGGSASTDGSASTGTGDTPAAPAAA